MINSSVLIGRITHTPELRKTPSNISVTSFTVAVNGHASEGREAPTYWIDCVAWRQTADFICNYFEKGQQIAVVGHLQTRTYTDKNGNDRKITEIVVDEVSFCGSKNKGKLGSKEGDVTNEAEQGGFEEVGTDEDLPF